jgi:isoamylase
MTAEDWESSFAKSIAVYLNGQGIPDLDVRGQPPTDFGAAWVPVIYTGKTQRRRRPNR